MVSIFYVSKKLKKKMVVANIHRHATSDRHNRKLDHGLREDQRQGLTGWLFPYFIVE